MRCNWLTLQFANAVNAFVVAAGICELDRGTEYTIGIDPGIVAML